MKNKADPKEKTLPEMFECSKNNLVPEALELPLVHKGSEAKKMLEIFNSKGKKD